MRTITEIVEILKEHNITGYQLEKDLDISQVGADKILNGSSKNPRTTTVKMLNSYVDELLNNGVNSKKDLHINNFKRLRLAAGYTQQEIADKLELSRQTIINYENGLSSVPKTTLLYLEGLLNKPRQVEYNNFMLVPMISKRAQAGYLSSHEDDEYIEDLPKVPWEVDKEYKGKYLCFEVQGDSMDDNSSERYVEGEILLCREIQRHLWKNKLHINKWDFIIVHRELGILLKRITDHNTETGKLILHSLNEMYEDQEVYMDDLLTIFNVVDSKRSRRR